MHAQTLTHALTLMFLKKNRQKRRRPILHATVTLTSSSRQWRRQRRRPPAQMRSRLHATVNRHESESKRGRESEMMTFFIFGALTAAIVS